MAEFLEPSETAQRQTYVYITPMWLRVLMVIAIVGCLVIAWFLLHDGQDFGFQQSHRWLTALGALALAGYVALSFRRRLTLAPDRFEYRGPIATITGRKDQLAGYRKQTYRSVTTYKFTLKAPDGRSFRVRDFSGRPGFLGWIADLPDLDAIEKAAYEAGLVANQAFGGDEATRARAVTFHRRLLWGINILGTAVAAWLLLLPFFHRDLAVLACIAMAVATIVIAALSGGRYALTYDIKNPRLTLAFACFAPMLSLAIYYFGDDGTQDQTAALPMAVAGGLVLLVLVRAIDRQVRLYSLAWAAVGLVAGVWGGLMAYDRLADTGPAVAYQTPIVEKYTTHSRSGTHYKVRVAAWTDTAAHPDALETLELSHDDYSLAQEGQEVCIKAHKGALHYRWFSYALCPASQV